MFLRYSSRKKDGKEHRYWSIVENKRVSDRCVVQRHVLYLGEINSSYEISTPRIREVRLAFESGQSRNIQMPGVQQFQEGYQTRRMVGPPGFEPGTYRL
jgi:hypothetical protein